MAKDVIIACDFKDKASTLEFLEHFTEEKPYLKVGMELFYAEGAEIVRCLKKRGHKVFLDLKLHDIPNTVKKTMSVLAKLDIDMINVHATGTKAMMSAALEGLSEGGKGKRPLLIAVTQLTSTAEETMRDELLIKESIDEVVGSYALNTKGAGLDGVVCSPREVAIVKERCGKDFLTITPGIRFAGSLKDDQKRITTPADAKALGSDYIVVGRPITQAENPLAVYRQCLKEFLD